MKVTRSLTAQVKLQLKAKFVSFHLFATSGWEFFYLLIRLRSFVSAQYEVFPQIVREI